MTYSGHTPTDFLHLLADSGAAGKKLRADLHANPRKVLKKYGIDAPPRAVTKPLRLPSPKRVREGLHLITKSRSMRSDPDEIYALLIVMIGAIPFVADGAR